MLIYYKNSRGLFLMKMKLEHSLQIKLVDNDMILEIKFILESEQLMNKATDIMTSVNLKMK